MANYNYRELGVKTPDGRNVSGAEVLTLATVQTYLATSPAADAARNETV